MSDEASTTGPQVFAEIATRAFAFLIDMGFRVVRSERTLVRFESGAVYVSVYHGRSSHQVGVELGRLDRPELYSLYEVLNAFAPDEVSSAGFQAVEPEVLDRSLRAVAKVLERRCRDVLAGDDTAFATLQATSSGLRRSATLSAQYGAVLDEADRAWVDGDHVRAADLYESAAPALDETRRRRLAFVRRKPTAG